MKKNELTTFIKKRKSYELIEVEYNTLYSSSTINAIFLALHAADDIVIRGLDKELDLDEISSKEVPSEKISNWVNNSNYSLLFYISKKRKIKDIAKDFSEVAGFIGYIHLESENDF